MRLLFVHEHLGARGGAEVNILATAGELARRGHEVALLYGSETGVGEPEWRQVFTRCFSWGGGEETVRCAAVLRDFDADAIFVHKLADHRLLELLVACDRPAIRMVHDHDLYCMRGYKYNYFSRRICARPASLFCIFPCGGCVGRGQGGRFSLRWISYRAKRREIAINRRFRRLVVATDYMRSELVRNGFIADRIEIHPPVPCASPGTATASLDERNRIVYAGQLIRGKGVDVLLEALARVTAPFECIIAGEGGARAACEQLSARLGLSDRVRFTGFRTRSEIAGYYRDASLGVMSSLWPEPFGASGLEAMQAGVPVVAFDAGGIREWLLDGVNGFLVPWRDAACFAARIDTLLHDKGLARQLGENGRRMIRERFDFGAYVDGLEDLFARLASPTEAAPMNLAN